MPTLFFSKNLDATLSIRFHESMVSPDPKEFIQAQSQSRFGSIKRRLALVVALIVIGAAIWIWRSPGPAPKIIGKLYEEDLLKIRKVLHDDMWRQAFPGVSWDTIRRSPRLLW